MCIGTCCNCCSTDKLVGGVVGGAASGVIGWALYNHYVEPGFKALDGTNEDEANALAGLIIGVSAIVGFFVGKTVGPVVGPVFRGLKKLCFFDGKSGKTDIQQIAPDDSLSHSTA